MDGHAFDDDDISSEEDEGLLEDFADASSRRAGDAGPSDAHGHYTSAFVNHKAGMDGVDKAHVRRVVDEMSKNSAHYRNENRKEEKVEAKIREMRAAHARLTPEHLARIQRDVDARVKTLEKKRDLSRTWIHVDMDAFYAAVHTLENPSLARIPIAVGGIGMISTANYVARTFGVRSAMPGFIAKKLCPHLTFVTPDFPKYRRYAELAREVFREFDADFDAVSLDEAFLDVTEYLETRGVDASAAAADLRAKVRAKTSGLTCSAGVAPNRRLAKVCSDMNKPDGQMVLANDREQILRLVNPLPVRKVGGVGKVNERVLAAFGMSACGDVFAKRAVVAALFSKSAFAFLLEASMGVGTERRPTRALLPGTQVARKSLGQEKTFAPTADRRVLERVIATLAEEVAGSLKEENLAARAVTLKIKRATFEVTQRQTSLHRAENSAAVLVEASLRLFRHETGLGSVRLVGVKASQLEGAERETEGGRKQTRVDAALDAAAGRLDVDPSADPSVPAATTYACACGRTVAEADRAEHEDWHFARGLLRRETEAADARVLARSNENSSGGLASKRRRRARDGAKADAKQKTLFDAFRAGDG
jgi:DNA polymerase kappa